MGWLPWRLLAGASACQGAQMMLLPGMLLGERWMGPCRARDPGAFPWLWDSPCSTFLGDSGAEGRAGVSFPGQQRARAPSVLSRPRFPVWLRHTSVASAGCPASLWMEQLWDLEDLTNKVLGD